MIAHNCKSLIYTLPSRPRNAVAEFLTLTGMDYVLICYYHDCRFSINIPFIVIIMVSRCVSNNRPISIYVKIHP